MGFTRYAVDPARLIRIRKYAYQCLCAGVCILLGFIAVFAVRSSYAQTPPISETYGPSAPHKPTLDKYETLIPGEETDTPAAASPAAKSPPPLPADLPSEPGSDAQELLKQLPNINVDAVDAVPPKDWGDEAEGEEDGVAEEKKIITREGPNGPITYVERSEDSEIILELLLDDRITIIDPGLSAYMAEETVLVPLGKFAELVEFPIKVDTSKGTADGWFIKPENTFHFSAPYKFIEIAGKKIPSDQLGIAETHMDDIYVSLDLLTSWFPIELTLNYGELRLYMRTLVDLPFQERAKRHSRWETSKLARQPGLSYDPDTIIRLPYRMYSAPSFAITHGYNANITPQGSTSSTSHGLSAQGDLFGMSARGGMSFTTATDNTEELQGLNFSLKKESFDADLLGPLKATSYALGDVSAGSFPLAGSQQGRGFNVTNEPYNFVRDASQFRISGFGPAGWDVEIFQDTDLLAFAEVSADGTYDFPTLPLGEGFNLFKIVLYGPNGEKEERYERFYLGQNMVEAGKFLYNVSGLQSSTPLFDVSTNKRPVTEPTLSLIGEYGLTKYLSLSSGYYRAPMGENMLDGVGAGLRASGGSTYAQFNTFFDKTGGQSSNVLVAGNLTPTTSFNVNHTLHHGFDPGYYSMERTTSAQLSRLFDFKSEIIPDVGLTLEARMEREATGLEKMSYLTRTSTNFMGLSLNNTLKRVTANDASPDTHEGNLSLRYRTLFATFRGDLNYRFYDPQELMSGTLSMQKDINDKLSLTTTLNHTFGDTPMTILQGSLDWKLEKMSVGLTGSIDDNENKQVGMTLSYNLVPRTITGDYGVAERADDVSTGRLLIRPYVDANGNNKYDEGEPLVKDVEFRNSFRGTSSKSDKDGMAVLPGLAPSLANRVTVDEKSIQDIFLTPVKDELMVLGKSGVNGPVDFAFSKLGFINGILSAVNAEGEVVPLENVHMLLLDKDGKEVAETYTEYDGYYSFDAVPVGRYQMFFPASEELQARYQGDGEGPFIAVSFDAPELNDVNLRALPDEIMLENPEQSAPPPAEDEKQGSIMDRLRHFALNMSGSEPAAITPNRKPGGVSMLGKIKSFAMDLGNAVVWDEPEQASVAEESKNLPRGAAALPARKPQGISLLSRLRHFALNVEEMVANDVQEEPVPVVAVEKPADIPPPVISPLKALQPLDLKLDKDMDGEDQAAEPAPVTPNRKPGASPAPATMPLLGQLQHLPLNLQEPVLENRLENPPAAEQEKPAQAAPQGPPRYFVLNLNEIRNLPQE